MNSLAARHSRFAIYRFFNELLIYKKADWGRQQSVICPNPYHLRNPREIKSSASLHHHFLALVDENVLTLGVISFEN